MQLYLKDHKVVVRCIALTNIYWWLATETENITPFSESSVGCPFGELLSPPHCFQAKCTCCCKMDISALSKSPSPSSSSWSLQGIKFKEIIENLFICFLPSRDEEHKLNTQCLYTQKYAVVNVMTVYIHKNGVRMSNLQSYTQTQMMEQNVLRVFVVLSYRCKPEAARKQCIWKDSNPTLLYLSHNTFINKINYRC